MLGEQTPDIYSLEPYLVKKSSLPKENITMDQLSKYINGWGDSKDAYSPWMKKLEKEKKMMTFSLQNITHSYHVATPVLEDVSIHIQKRKSTRFTRHERCRKKYFTKNSNW